MTKKEAAKLGGLALFAKYGSKHMSIIGKAGARTFNERYKLVPYGTFQWAIVRRFDNEVIGYTTYWRHNVR